MKIVIAGAGEVGTHLAKMLSQEDQDIILMDADINRLNAISNPMDIMTFAGSPTSLNDLQDAGVKDVDLFVSVTPEETMNITSCILASNLGAKQTIARINNYEYLIPKNKDFFNKIGVGSMIYPEILAAEEVVSAIRWPWMRQYWDLLGGAFSLIGVKVRENAPIVNKQLLQLLSSEKKKYHVVAIKHKNKTIIPRGMDKIEAGDILFFTCTREHIKDVQQETGKKSLEVKRVIIMGGSRIAIRACQYLPDSINIKIIEIDREKSFRIADEVPDNVLIINGDARDPYLLEQEGIRDTDAFVALSENSSTNILACVAAKRYEVAKTIAKIENIDYIQLAEKMDIGSVINKKLIAASHIYRYLLDADVSNVKFLTFAEADVAEFIARPGSKITKKKIKDLKLPRNMTLGGLIRNGVPMLIEGDTQIQTSDHVVVFCIENALRQMKDYFN